MDIFCSPPIYVQNFSYCSLYPLKKSLLGASTENAALIF